MLSKEGEDYPCLSPGMLIREAKVSQAIVQIREVWTGFLCEVRLSTSLPRTFGEHDLESAVVDSNCLCLCGLQQITPSIPLVVRCGNDHCHRTEIRAE